MPPQTRKRAFEPSVVDGQEYDSDVDDARSHYSQSSKRSRSSNWPLPKGNTRPRSRTPSMPPRPSPSSTGRRRASSSTRASRFQEASMHDRTSNKPPSMFLRVNSATGAPIPNMDQLMEEYLSGTTDGEAVDITRRKMAQPRSPRRSTRGAEQITTNGAVEASDPATTEKSGGIFRFGRSLAAHFNPVNVIKRIQNTYQEVKREQAVEAAKENRQLMQERQAKAEAAYAVLKKEGKLGAQGTQGFAVKRTTRVYAAGYNATPNNLAANRDSGVQMDDEITGRQSTTSFASNRNDRLEKSNYLTVGGTGVGDTPAPRRSFFRAPSFASLKKTRSEVHLKEPTARESGTSLLNQRHGSSAQYSVDTNKQPDEHLLRKVQSKKDLVRQQKLSKRISDLEVKLRGAQQELDSAMTGASNAPPLPAWTPGAWRKSLSPVKRAAGKPGLPTLPSERLLFPDQLEQLDHEGQRGEVEPDVRDSIEVGHTAHTMPAFDPPTPPVISDDGLSDVSDGDELGHKDTGPILPTLENCGFDEMVHGDSAEPPADIWTQALDNTPTARPAAKGRKPAPRRTGRKRKSGGTEDKTGGGHKRYNPRADSEPDDDAEWAAANRDSRKRVKRRSSGVAASASTTQAKETTRAAKKKTTTAKEKPTAARGKENVRRESSTSSTTAAWVEQQQQQQQVRPTTTSDDDKSTTPRHDTTTTKTATSKPARSPPPPNKTSRIPGIWEGDRVSLAPDASLGVPPVPTLPPLAHSRITSAGSGSSSKIPVSATTTTAQAPANRAASSSAPAARRDPSGVNGGDGGRGEHTDTGANGAVDGEAGGGGRGRGAARAQSIPATASGGGGAKTLRRERRSVSSAAEERVTATTTVTVTAMAATKQTADGEFEWPEDCF